jgi:phosphatidylserine decarboxylase
MICILSLVALFFLWRLYFLRDPKRTPPSGNVLVSPADGYVLYIKPVAKGEIPMAIKNENRILLSEVTGVPDFNNCSGTLVGIWMTALSVHRNRAPLSGTVVLKKHHKNELNLSMIRPPIELLFKPKTATPDHPYYLTNERLTTGIQTERGTLFITQIADQWINRIVSWVDEGESVETGQQYGMIRFGSQCDLFIPDSMDLNLTIQKGQYLYAGESVIGTYR